MTILPQILPRIIKNIEYDKIKLKECILYNQKCCKIQIEMCMEAKWSVLGYIAFMTTYILYFSAATKHLHEWSCSSVCPPVRPF